MPSCRDSFALLIINVQLAMSARLLHCALPRWSSLAWSVQHLRLLGSAQVTAYWLSHYPARIGHHMADRRCRSDIDLERKSRPVQPDKGAG